MPFLAASAVACAIWVAAGVPLVRELCRRFRGNPRAVLPILLAFCTLLEIAVAAGGSVWLVLGDFRPTRFLGWSSLVLVPILMAVPFGFCFVLFVLRAASMAWVAGKIPPGPFFCLVLPVCLLLLFSPFLRFWCLSRAPVSRPRTLAALSLLGTYLPLLPIVAAFVIACPV